MPIRPEDLMWPKAMEHWKKDSSPEVKSNEESDSQSEEKKQDSIDL